MKFVKLALVLVAVTFFVFACSQNSNINSVANSTANSAKTNANVTTNSSPATTTDELASVRKIYSEKCASCHKEDGSGGIKDVDGKQIRVPNFHSDRLMNDKDEDWIDTIANGAKEDGMPAFKGTITDEEIKNLVKFIHIDIQKKK